MREIWGGKEYADEVSHEVFGGVANWKDCKADSDDVIVFGDVAFGETVAVGIVVRS